MLNRNKNENSYNPPTPSKFTPRPKPQGRYEGTQTCPVDPGGYPPGSRRENEYSSIFKREITIEDIMSRCWLIHKYKSSEGTPSVVNGLCNGYQADVNNDEPCEQCQECKFCVHYEE